MDANAYARQLKELLPPGALWLLELTSGLSKLLLGISDELARIHARAAKLVDEAFPDTADEMIGEWEESLSLPDECLTTIPTLLVDRQVNAAAKLSNQGGQKPAYFVGLATSLGATATITNGAQDTPALRAGFRAGARCYGDTRAFVWTMHLDPANWLGDSGFYGTNLLTMHGTVTRVRSRDNDPDGGYLTAAQFNGNSANYLSVDDALLQFEGITSTWEAWVKPDALGTERTIFGIWGATAAEQRWRLLMTTGGGIWLEARQTDGTIKNCTVATGFTAGAWAHVAVTLGPTAIRCFLNGTPSTSTAIVGDLRVVSAGGRVMFGASLGGGVTQNWLGAIDEVRAMLNAQYFGTPFTPPASTFTANGFVYGLWHFGDTRPVLECRVRRSAPSHTHVLFSYE